MSRLLTLLILLSGCKHVDQSDPKPPLIDMDAVERAAKRFETAFNVEVDSTIEFDASSYDDLSTSGTGTIGKCFVQGNHITIDKRFWDDAPSDVQESILFHELAHCLLGLGHDNVRGIMSGFIGHSANSFRYEYHEGVEYMKNMPCEFGCDLDRIINNRSNL